MRDSYQRNSGRRNSGGSARRLLVIYNPAAGRRRQRLFRATLNALDALGCPLELRETRGPGHAEALSREAPRAACDLLVAAGGDGTVNEVVNGLAGRRADGGTPPLAVLPLGTANVLAAEIGAARTPRELARMIAFGPPRPISLGRANGRFFSLMAGIGFDARAVAAVDIRLKRHLGKGAYVWAFLGQLADSGSRRYRVTLDGKAHEAGSLIVAKGRYYAGRYLLAPAARLEEPRFKVCLFKRGGPWNTLSYGAALLAGALSRHPGVELLAAERIGVEAPAGEPVQADGDIIARLPVEIDILPEALDLVMPC
jgi:YegS/Rv2252/BmrU family lipid kinase